MRVWIFGFFSCEFYGKKVNEVYQLRLLYQDQFEIYYFVLWKNCSYQRNLKSKIDKLVVPQIEGFAQFVNR